MDTPLLIVLIQEKVQDEKIRAALVRAYNNFVAQIQAFLLTLVPIVASGAYEIIRNSSSLEEVFTRDNWKWLIFFVIDQLLALYIAAQAKANRTA